MLKVIFMGTPDFAIESLKGLYEKGYSILGVVTNEDRPKGRGMKLIPTPVKEYALEKNLTVFQPKSVKDNPVFIKAIKDLNPDVICVVAYGKILPKEILELPRLGCINVHGSLLPKYRGAAPIQWAVLNGDKTTGLTTIYMDEGMDSGDMILKQEIEIGDDETTGELWNRLSSVGADLLIKTLVKIEEGTAPRQKQPKEYSIAPMLNKEMSKIDWNNKTAKEIKNLVRGLNPIMGAYSIYEDKKIKFWKVKIFEMDKVIEDFPDYKEKITSDIPGTILIADPKIGLYIKAKNGIIQVLELQSENARKMKYDEFLRGNKLEEGKILK